MSEEPSGEKILLPHHEQQELCTSRMPYREGKKLTAVKVYTTNNESRHLLLFGIPALNIKGETKNLCGRYGTVRLYNVTSKYKSQKFTETYHIIYETIKQARLAKKKLDNKTFYGGSLHVCYAPELESIEETREKLQNRNNEVLNRLRKLQKSEKEATEQAQKKAETNQKVKGELKLIKVKNQDIQNIKRGEIKKVAVKVSDVQGLKVKKITDAKTIKDQSVAIKRKISNDDAVVVSPESSAKVTKKIVVLKKYVPEFVQNPPASYTIVPKDAHNSLAPKPVMLIKNTTLADSMLTGTIISNEMSNEIITNEVPLSNDMSSTMTTNEMTHHMVTTELSGQMINVEISPGILSNDISSTVANSIILTSGTPVDLDCGIVKHSLDTMEETLNYANFGNEMILGAPQKNMNTIIYHNNDDMSVSGMHQ